MEYMQASQRSPGAHSVQSLLQLAQVRSLARCREQSVHYTSDNHTSHGNNDRQIRGRKEKDTVVKNRGCGEVWLVMFCTTGEERIRVRLRKFLKYDSILHHLEPPLAKIVDWTMVERKATLNSVESLGVYSTVVSGDIWLAAFCTRLLGGVLACRYYDRFAVARLDWVICFEGFVRYDTIDFSEDVLESRLNVR